VLLDPDKLPASFPFARMVADVVDPELTVPEIAFLPRINPEVADNPEMVPINFPFAFRAAFIDELAAIFPASLPFAFSEADTEEEQETVPEIGEIVCLLLSVPETVD
jgi:hypothetical protein